MTSILDQQYNKFTLKHNKKKLDQLFLKKNEPLQAKLYVSYTYGMILFYLIQVIIAGLYIDTFSMIYKILQILMLILCKVFFNNKQMYHKYILIFSHFIEIFYLSEISYPKVFELEDQLQKVTLTLFTGIILTIESFFALIPTSNWIMQYTIWQITIFYALLRTMQEMVIFFIAPSLIFGAMMGYFFYQFQKFQVEIFLRDYQFNKSEQKWKKLIEKNIPSAFIVLKSIKKKFQITFFNQSCKQYFKINNQSELLRKFEQINIKKQYKQEQEQYSNIFNEVRAQKNIENLINLIEFTGNLIVNNNIKVNLSNCQYYDISKKETAYFDIVMFGCKWDNQKSLIINLNDISEKLRLQRMNEIDNYKNQLLATVTHDLKTPLNGMISILQAAKSMSTINKLNYYINIVLNNSFLLLYQINDILDFSRSQKDNLKLQPESFQMNQVLQEVKELMQFLAEDKQITLELICYEEQILIMNDKNRLKQILINLVGNAIKFTLKGFIQIIVEKAMQPNQIQISVKDSGVGIPKELIPKLFQLFSTFDHNNGSNKHGVGLGLAICKQLIQLIGPQQEIQIQSVVGNGTTISFVIYQQHINNDNVIIEQQIYFNPYNKLSQSYKNERVIRNRNFTMEQMIEFKSMSNSQEQLNDDGNIPEIIMAENYQSQQSIQQIKRLTFKSICQIENITISQQLDLFPQLTKILIVDDNTFNILGLKIQFEEYKNIEIEEAHNGQEALDKIKLIEDNGLSRYQIIFMDVNMPIMDGIEAIKIIRKDYLHIDFKIISFTAYSDKKDQQKCLEAGANFVLLKPITKDSLFDALSKVIQ